MNATVEDLRPTIIPKSDQLNSEQLLAGPITIRVTDVEVSSTKEQPVIVHYEGENGRPYKPCLTMRKVLIFAWGENGLGWIGRSMTLYNDPAVKFGGEAVGGIRISHMTDIPKGLQVSLTATKGKKALHKIDRMEAPATGEAQAVALIKSCTSIEDLKATFGTAYRASKDAAVRARLKTAYDERMAALKSGAKSVDDYIGEIDGATSEEAAALVLDEAKTLLSEADAAKVAEAFEMAWKA